MPKQKQINLHLFNGKLKTISLVDDQVTIGEFRAFYKPYFNTDRNKRKVSNSAQLYEYLLPLFEVSMEDTEQFTTVFLSRSNEIIYHTVISTGGITGTIVDIQIILRHAILLNAKAVVASHNHPSGNLKPSESDLQITNKLKEACRLLDISLLDHLILTSKEYYSFADNGLL